MSTQVNLHVQLTTSDHRATDMMQNHPDALKLALEDAVERILREQGYANMFLKITDGPRVETT